MISASYLQKIRRQKSTTMGKQRRQNGVNASPDLLFAMMICPILLAISTVESFSFPTSTSLLTVQSQNKVTRSSCTGTSLWATKVEDDVKDAAKAASSPDEIFEQFTDFIMNHQKSMIAQIEQVDGSGCLFTRDGWGAFANTSDADSIADKSKSGGITRVIQGGDVVEKGACSLTVIRNGVLTADRAATIRGRQEEQGAGDVVVREGDSYSAAALSVVLHTRNPYVPTFRSDVRIFLVKSSTDNSKSTAWFGGGSDLTPYYLIDQDIINFHTHLQTMCNTHFPPESITDNDDNTQREQQLSYKQMKKSCDEYFYLPARSEHRGVGGIFFDDLDATENTLDFVRDVAEGWMPSWLPIVEKRGKMEYGDEERHWQCLRRGRYLEFNLLYDRGVKFGLANANPRVEGVMVSAPPQIAFDYNHVPKEGSEEERLIKILKSPIDWVK